ncbi:hypothetical protein BSPWISOXPB_4455 [uncultured Gammaproteobacteria bacterium]|nr:hypothetical protein BSPWISOXPB_4455 [uncultured Gammaproteobacteria bacterium]
MVKTNWVLKHYRLIARWRIQTSLYLEWVEEHADIGVPALFIDAPEWFFDSETDDGFRADDVGEVLKLNWFE